MPRERKSMRSKINPRKEKSSLPPGEIEVLKVLVKSALKQGAAAEISPSTVSFGVIRVDYIRHELIRNGKRLEANAREFQLLKYFLAHEGEVVTRDQLLKDVWRFEETPETRSVDNYILSLRKKIEEDTSHPRHIITYRGAGYKFVRGDLR